MFFGRLVPVVRSVVSIPAGADRMPALQFTLLTAAGSLLWNTVWIVLGQQLGHQWHRAEEWSGIVEKVVIVAAILGVVAFVVQARRRRARIEAAEAAAATVGIDDDDPADEPA